MIFNFKSEELLIPSIKPIKLQETHCSTSFEYDDSIEPQISELSPVQRINYRNDIFENICQITTSQNIEDPQIKNEIFQELKRCIELLSKLAEYDTPIPPNIFRYIIKFASKQNLLDTIFLFVVSSFKQNPTTIDQLFHEFHQNIDSFLDRFSHPFNPLHFEFANTLINSSRKICDELIVFGLVDRIQTGILFYIQHGDDLSHYWIFALKILNQICDNCSSNIVMFNAICDICFLFLDDSFHKNVVLQSIECIVTISSKTEDLSYLTKFSQSFNDKYLFFFNKILDHNNNLYEVKPIMNLISIISTKCKEVDLYKNCFIQYLISLSSFWNQIEFESVFEYLFQMLTFILRYHQKLITDIVNSDILNIAVFYMSNGGCAIKDQVSLFISRLCANCFWNYFYSFIEANSEIVFSLFMMLETETKSETKISIIYGLSSLARNIKLSNKYAPNTISQFTAENSIDAFIEAQNSEDENIRAACNVLNQAVNDLIQGTK